jgi:hypothetical protein
MDVGRDDVGQPAAMTIVLMISSAVRSGAKWCWAEVRRGASGHVGFRVDGHEPETSCRYG